MGDSSEGVSSAHETHLQEYDCFKFIDDGDSVGDDAASETSTLLKSTVTSAYPMNNKVLSNGDQNISSDLLSKPVPPQREGDTCAEDTNGHSDDFGEREPIVSLSMIRGKQANGFDEVAHIEGSEEEIPSNSGSWCESDLTDNESSETELVRIGDERHQIYEDIITSEPGEFRNFGVFEDLKTGRPLNGQSSNLHQELYSSKSRNEDFVGYGENMASYNYTTTRCSGNNNVYPSDTYKNMGSTFRGMSYARFPTFGLTAPSMCVPSTAPRPSLSSPIVSGGCNSRHQLPYETAPQPPFGKRLDEPRLRNSAVGLLCSTHDGLVSPRGMPKAEPIGVAASMSSISANDAEINKKKKKKKKRNGGGMKGDSDAADKKSPLREESNVVAPATYGATHLLDAGAPVMDHEQRSKMSRNKGGKKKKTENVIKAREIAGHRGSDDVDTLVGYVEGSRKKTPGGTTQEKKGRRQRQTGRINGERLEEGEEEEKVQEVQKVEVTRQNEMEEEVKEKEEYDLEFTNFEGLVDAEEEMPFEKYVGRRKKVRGPSSGKPASQPVPTPPQPNRGPAARWGPRTFARPPVRPLPAPRPPPAKEDFPPLRAPTQSLAKVSWNFQQVHHFLETLYPGEKEKCSFYSDAGRKAHHLPPPTLSS